LKKSKKNFVPRTYVFGKSGVEKNGTLLKKINFQKLI